MATFDLTFTFAARSNYAKIELSSWFFLQGNIYKYRNYDEVYCAWAWQGEPLRAGAPAFRRASENLEPSFRGLELILEEKLSPLEAQLLYQETTSSIEGFTEAIKAQISTRTSYLERRLHKRQKKFDSIALAHSKLLYL